MGPGSLKAAQAADFVNLHDGGGTAETVLQRLCAARPRRPLVHMCGAHVVTDLAGRLRTAGLVARAQVCYDQNAQPLNDAARACLCADGAVVVPLFSPRSARLFAAEWSGMAAPRAALHMVAISRAAADGAASLPKRSLFALGQVQAALEPEQKPR